jgi:serine/threonine-protein kinase
MASMVGRKLAGFTVEREIGRGGMGVVMLARQESLDRPAVLKRIIRELAEHPELEKRFEREARTAAALHHQNVVAVYDRFTHRGEHFIAQEFVDGVDLAAALLVTGSLPWRMAGLIVLEAARGLEEIHARGTLHRDIKPENLLLGRRGEVKIGDFGLALDTSGTALTQPGIALGTPQYMAPEQILGERVDTRADVFAIGCVLYELLTGRPPYGRPVDEADGSLIARIRKERYEPVRRERRRIPRGLARLVGRCLRSRAKRRLASAAELRRELEKLLSHPSPADARAEIASWLWKQSVFETRENETVVLLVRSSASDSPKRGRRALALALAASLLAAALAVQRVFPSAIEAVEDSASRIIAAASFTE